MHLSDDYKRQRTPEILLNYLRSDKKLHKLLSDNTSSLKVNPTDLASAQASRNLSPEVKAIDE